MVFYTLHSSKIPTNLGRITEEFLIDQSLTLAVTIHLYVDKINRQNSWSKAKNKHFRMFKIIYSRKPKLKE